MFIHLRTHSVYSLLKGSIKIEELVSLCVQNNMPAVAITDLGNLFGSLEFAEYAAAKGVQPIIGCVLMVKYLDNTKTAPVLLLAKNKQGYINLVNLVSESFKKCKYQNDNPYIDIDHLFSLRDGLIVLTGGNDGILSQLILEGSKDSISIIKKLLSLFEGNMYVELQRHGLEEGVEEKLIDFAYSNNVPLVATNGVFFAGRDDYEAYDVLTCIAAGGYVLDESRNKLTSEYYFKSSSEMQKLFSDIPEAINNTMLIAQRCAFMPKAQDPILPKFPCSSGKTEADELKEQASSGLQLRLASYSLDDEAERKYYDRLNYELDVIISMNYPGYFLIVSDFICWSKKNGIPVGPGRGSGAGSLVAWALQITELDPLKFGLIFERFLNPGRISMPDFDIDFCQEGRDNVISYVKEKYGYVAQIITFGKLQAKAVLRDVGRVMQMPYSQVDKICKMIPFNPVNPVTLSQAIAMDKNLQRERDSDKTVSRLLDISLKLEGICRHVSTHAAGIVICDRKLEDLIPIYYDPNSDLPITQYSMKYVEKAGLVKFDFLGLSTLTLIKHTCNLINRDEEKFNISSISLSDRKTYELLSSGDSIGIFQLESSGMRETLIKLKPDCIEDIIALISLYRPGPMNNIPTYIARKHGLEKVDYLHPMLENVLKETFGVIIYQEQVMEMARIMSGYSLVEADLLRRAMGKKIKEEMDQQRKTFINGAVKNSINKERASYIFDLIAKFAGYGFNKSHAAAYALIAYQTAYLKANYPLEFFTALMNLNINDRDKLSLFCNAAKLSGVKISPPNISYSQAEFSIENGAIRYGLGALRNVGVSAAQEITNKRTKPYSDIWDFLDSAGCNLLNKRLLESVIKSGACDSVHKNRKQLHDSVGTLLDSANQNKQDLNQSSLFGNLEVTKPNLTSTEDWQQEEKLEQEFFALGFYLQNHPLEKYQKLLEKLKINFIGNTKNHKGGIIAGIISNVRMRTSERGRFAIVTISDPYNISEVAFYDDKIIEEKRELFLAGLAIIIDLGVVGDNARLVGRNIYDFSGKVASMISQLVIEVEDTSDIDELSLILKSKGRSKVTIVVIVQDYSVEINLQDGYLITQDIIKQISDLKWIKKIEFS